MGKRSSYDYRGELADVHWDARLCIHVAECSQAQGELFVAGRQPWCIPDKSSPQELAAVCERCPSGALTYTDKSGRSEQAAPENTVNVIHAGPLYLRGDLKLQDAPMDMVGIRFRAALCRCGQSRNKPFCDNTHLETGFRDPGAIGESGPGSQARSGALSIRPVPNGPLLLSGPATLIAGSGRVAWQGESIALCRCGESKNKPFCDGNHKAANFRAD
jgi:CDGSH-type Zn-finger protein/uncharacterized Fe-S cluster protein YjdI